MKIRDFVGNERLVSLLRRAQLPPTTLFSGPEGVGKKALAIALAARANCRRPEPDDACGDCSSCRKLESGQHPDVTVIDRGWLERFAKGQKKSFNPQVIPIAVARELVREAQYRPYESALRFFIVDDAEKLNESAANALLKTLEEPPDTTRFILVSVFPESLLETVRSRCQQFLFQALERRLIQAHLQQLGDSDAELKAAFANGSIGRALSLDMEKERHDRGCMAQLLTDWVRRHSYARLYRAIEGKELRPDLKNRERVLELLSAVRSLVEDRYFLKMGQPPRVVNQDRLESLEEAAERSALDWLRQFLYHIDASRQDVQQYVNPLMAFEALWLESLEHAGNRSSQV